MSVNYDKTPWPYFGGKADAAEAVWAALGDVPHYVEPFAGSLAVLLRRPHQCNRAYYSETVNDLDGLLVNAWRAIAADPDGVAEAASWPVSEIDLMARHLALVEWSQDPQNVARLRADPAHYDARMAGWWAWGQSCWIGGGWCSGKGPWRVNVETGCVERVPGKGRCNGQLPNNDGKGVNHAGLREPGVYGQLPFLGNDGKGVNRPQLREPGVAVADWHPMAMPELRNWLGYLAARLRHVRILCGDWNRAVTSGAAKTLPVRQGKGPAGIFLDPPYIGDVRSEGLYAHDDLQVAHAVREWCCAHESDPQLRIVLAGFDDEHTELEGRGWQVVEWWRAGFLKGGMGNIGKDGHQQKRERLWLSPTCIRAVAEQSEVRQQSLFGEAS